MNKSQILLTELKELDAAIGRLPKGYINEKLINGKVYHYLQHREGKRVISDYLPDYKLATIGRKIKYRKFLEAMVKEVKKELATTSK